MSLKSCLVPGDELLAALHSDLCGGLHLLEQSVLFMGCLHSLFPHMSVGQAEVNWLIVLPYALPQSNTFTFVGGQWAPLSCLELFALGKELHSSMLVSQQHA